MEEIIYDFSKYGATNALHAQFATDSLGAVPKEVAEAQGFSKQWTNFSTHVNNELASFKKDKAYLDTEEIAEKDAEREKPLMFYNALSSAYANFALTPEEKEAGRVIAFAFDQAGYMQRLPYAEETATITQFTNKLRQEPYLSALPVIHMEDAPDVIDEANNAFHELYMERSKENRDRAFAVPMKTLRKNTDEAFNELAKAINALYAVNEMVTNDESKREALKKLIDDLNAIVVRFQMDMKGKTSVEEEEVPGTEEPSTGDDTQEPENPDGGDGGDEENPSGPGIPNP